MTRRGRKGILASSSPAPCQARRIPLLGQGVQAAAYRGATYSATATQAKSVSSGAVSNRRADWLTPLGKSVS